MSVKTPVPGVPTLHSITNPILTKKEDVATHLIMFFFANPGGTSEVTEGEMLSFRKLIARYGSVSLDDLSSHIASIFTECLNHYFPDDGLTASCSIEEETGYSEGFYQGNYSVTIAIRDADGNAIMPSNKIKVSKDGSKFQQF